MKTLLCLILVVLTGAGAHSQIFNVNGHKLFLECQGKRSKTTVVLLAGGEGTTETWDKVQQPISQFARVCSYDRLGLGRSDALGGSRTQSVDEIVTDLESLLRAAQITPPYVLVGHSVGGLYARAFDKRFDNEVASMVLLDSSHEEQIWRFARDEPDALSEYPLWKDQSAMSIQGFLPPGKHLSWQFSKPLIVIEHGIPPEPVWHEMQKDLASRSPKGQLITATNSSHYIQKLQPTLVIDAVRAALKQNKPVGTSLPVN